MSDTNGGRNSRNPQDATKRQYEPGVYGRGGEEGRDRFESDEAAREVVSRHAHMQDSGAGDRGEVSSANTPGDAGRLGGEGHSELEQRGVRELRLRARQLHIHNRSKMNKQQLIEAIRSMVR